MTNVAGGCWAHLDVLDLDRDELVKALLESARLCGNDGEQGGVRGRGRQNACVRENKRQAAGSVAEQRARLGETKGKSAALTGTPDMARVCATAAFCGCGGWGTVRT
jgi:hypothetical protein